MRIPAVLLYLTFGVATLVGCAGDQRSSAQRIADSMEATRAAVRASVDELDRREQLLALVDELEGLLQAQSADLEQLSLDLRRLNADPEAPRPAFEGEIAVYTQRRRSRRTRAVDIHYAMMDLTRSEEWDEIIAQELDAMRAMGPDEGS